LAIFRNPQGKKTTQGFRNLLTEPEKVKPIGLGANT